MTVPALPVPSRVRGIVVRKLVIAQRAGEGSGIIDSGGDSWYIGERNVGRINGCGWAGIAGIVSRGHGKLFAAAVALSDQY